MAKKPAAGRRPKAKRKTASDENAALMEVLNALDPETLARVRDTLLASGETAGEDTDDVLAMFEDFLRRLETYADHGAPEDEDFFDDVVMTLTQVSIDDNGGHPRARELKASVYERLDDTLAEERLDASSLVLVAKVFNDSGWSVPDNLKSRVVEMLEAGGAPEPEIGGGDLASALTGIGEAAEGDAFAAYEALNSVMAAFPAEAAAQMVGLLGQGESPVMLQTLAGFVMHRERPLAIAAIEELKRVGKASAVESALVERLVRMRPWLPADRQEPLDETIRALRANARAPVEAERPAAANCYVMACDGSGAGGALASLKARDGWRFVAAMTKPAGVVEVLSLEGLGKRQVDATVREMRENVIAAQTDAAGVARYLQLALGENLAARNPPPFKLIGLAENLGLGPISPRILSPTELIAELLADAPETETDAAAVARAHQATLGAGLEQPWFESGEAVERLLGPIRGRKGRMQALLTAYLPERRAFWARACAITAFVLELDRKAFGALGRNLALVGRDIAAGAPLEPMPLMRQIADATVRAYDSRR